MSIANRLRASLDMSGEAAALSCANSGAPDTGAWEFMSPSWWCRRIGLLDGLVRPPIGVHRGDGFEPGGVSGNGDDELLLSRRKGARKPCRNNVFTVLMAKKAQVKWRYNSLGNSKRQWLARWH